MALFNTFLKNHNKLINLFKNKTKKYIFKKTEKVLIFPFPNPSQKFNSIN